MTRLCPICLSPRLSPYRESDGYRLCEDCARRKVAALIGEEDINKLRRRAEDMLRKNPAALRRVLVDMIIAGDLSLGGSEK